MCLSYLIESPRRFKSKLPDLCGLLRSKVFRHSPFSNASSSAGTDSRSASPALSSTSAHRGTIPHSSHHDAIRSRSRSLSVTLAQDADDRARRASTAGKNKKILNREVSMSRCFKPKRKEQNEPLTAQRKGIKQEPGDDTETNPRRGVTLVADTPVKIR